ncbi:MAG: O-antigen ligase family protein [Nitrospiraceae bacterium]
MASWRAVQTYAYSVAGWAAAALGFSLPISTSLDGILLVVALVAWTISGTFTELPRIVRQNRLPLLLPGFFVLVAFGMVHGLAPFSERAKHLWKYDDFLLPLVFIPLFVDPDVRERGLWGFGVSMVLTLILSLLGAAGWTPAVSWFHGNQENATVFRHEITHNLLMAFAALLFAGVAVRQRVPWRRYGSGLLALFAVADVFMFVQGRTGQVVLSALIVLWCERRFGARGLFVGVAAVSILVAVSYVVSPVFHARVEKTATEMEEAQVETVAPVTSSVGIRVEWYKNTVNLIAAHPMVGVGTGSFARAYAEMVMDPAAVKPSHPHNQYLLTAAELGVAGAGLLAALFGILWWRFRRAGGDLYGELGQGVVIAMAIGCVFNSLLVDHTEGLFFAWMISAALATEGRGVIGESC